MRLSMVSRGLSVFSLLTLAGVSVLVFHSAALAQQAAPTAKGADKAGAQKAAAEKIVAEPAPEAGAKEQAEDQPKEQAKEPAAEQPGELPPGYGPPPGYRHAPPPPHYAQPGYAPYYGDDYYGQPSYPPPPRRYYRPRPYQPPPARYYPEPVAYRAFFFGVGLGVGGVALFPDSGDDKTVSRPGMSYNLHFGFGVSPHWSVVLSGDGAFAYFDGYNIDQSVWSIGPQVFITPRLYARLGLGVATKSVDYNSDAYDHYSDDSFTDSGMGWTAAIGWEFLQSYHTALGLELAATFGHYQNDDTTTGSKNQGTIGVNFMLHLF